MTLAQRLRSMRMLALFVLVTTVVTACSVPVSLPAEEASVPEGSRGASGTLNIIYWQAPSTLNPYLSGGAKEIHAASAVLEPLAHYDPDGVMIPYLVEEIPTVENGGVSEDLMSITWKLTDGVLWSDGTPFTAADVVFSWQYCTHEDMGCNPLKNFESVESVEALDDLTVKINFVMPKPFPYGPFVGSTIPVLQKAQFENCMGVKAQECTEENFAPIGTGPYKVQEFRANDTVVYEMNEKYREPDKPYFTEVVLKGGGDAAAAARGVLETGEADYAWNLQVEEQTLRQMEEAGIGTVVKAFGPSVERLIVNFTNPDPALGKMRSQWSADDPNPHPFLTDYSVRKALSMAIDREAANAAGYGSGGQPGCNIVPAPPYQASTANEDCLVQDIDGAKELLEDAGWIDEDGDGVREKDGVRLSILYQTSTNDIRQSYQALIKQWWADIGVETELRNIDPAVFFGGDLASPDTYQRFYADIEMYTSYWDGMDAEPYMVGWTCDEIPTAANQYLGNNIPRWCNEEYDALVEVLASTVGVEARGEVVKRLNDLIVQDFALIPLTWRGNVSAHANSLRGVRMNAWDSELWNIADWYREE